MRNLLSSLALVAALLTSAHAADDPNSEGVQLEWRSPTRLAVTARVALPNGCHQPVDIREITPEGAPPIANALAATIKINIAGGMCSQDYRIHRFDLTIKVPADIAGLVIYEVRTGKPIKAMLYPLPTRPTSPHEIP
ncbi:hypothetical protein [Govanella unica]|uniref:Uncharacterized protein n=1 Tax=Govanella unica TaxID=2975056 RepID=A0A9X3U295_9PROT|nr:hypothetical protein [Govania unica]MDA5195099.1 hypothetical protein [Govania unica]